MLGRRAECDALNRFVAGVHAGRSRVLVLRGEAGVGKSALLGYHLLDIASGWPVFAQILKGRWRYLEHDWVAEEGGFAFEPPGETHTLVIPDDCTEMVTLFQVTGALIYVDQDGAAMGYEDVFTRLEKTRRHFDAAGVAPEYLRSLIR
jgi:hypothetical protein